MGDLTNKMGLAAWDQVLDPYNYQQLANNWQILDFHDHSPGRGTQIPGAGIAAGAIAPSHISTSLAAVLGTGAANRGVSNNPNAATTTSTTPGPLSDAADQVSGIVVGTNALIEVAFHALWAVTTSPTTTGTATLYLNTTPVLAGITANSYANVTATNLSTTSAGFYIPIFTQNGTLISPNTASASPTEVTTGETIGGNVQIFVAAGTYTVSVKWSVTSGGTATAKNRWLWVNVQPFT